MPDKNIPSSFPDCYSKQIWENTSGLAQTKYFPWAISLVCITAHTKIPYSKNSRYNVPPLNSEETPNVAFGERRALYSAIDHVREAHLVNG